MPSVKHYHYLTFLGRLVFVLLMLPAATVIFYTFWPSNHAGHPEYLEAYSPKSDQLLLSDLKEIETRLRKLEVVMRERESLQRQAIAAISETKLRLRSLETQVNMIHSNSENARLGIEEIRDLLRDHVVKTNQHTQIEEKEEKSETIIVPGTVH